MCLFGNKTMKNALFIIGLIIGVALFTVAIGYFFYSQIDYVDLAEKEVFISENDDELLIKNKEGEVVFVYKIEEWRESVSDNWNEIFEEPIKIDEVELTPESFSRFTGVSPFPEGLKSLGFSVSTYAMPKDVSLFWVLDIGTGELNFVGEKNNGVIGYIIWSPQRTHFAYFLNTEKAPGEYLTVDNAITKEKEFTLSGEDILEILEKTVEEFSPEFRDMEWSEDGEKLFFATNGVDKEDVFWSIGVDGSDLMKEE